MEKNKARKRAIIGKGVLGIFIIAAFFSCGCIDPEVIYITPEPEVIYMPTRMISGIEGVYDYNNGICEDIWVSGIDNVLYVDYCDNVRVSGIDNEVIRG